MGNPVTKRRGRFWKPKPPAHIRGWGAGPKHSEPLAKRDSSRRDTRLFVLIMKRDQISEVDLADEISRDLANWEI